MKIIKYVDANDIIVEFQDEYKCQVHSNYQAFKDGGIKNSYHPWVYGVGMVGNKYPSRINGKMTKEYHVWREVLTRCFGEEYKNEHITYQNVSCDNGWLLFDNFYEWLHLQNNFNKWLVGSRWDVDKDILYKNNKIYSSETCLLVPHNVNVLFVTKNTVRGDLPIGVTRHCEKFRARCENQLCKSRKHLGLYDTPEDAFLAYKKYKENLIKQIAQIEFDKENITKECYDAMMKYEVEITD